MFSLSPEWFLEPAPWYERMRRTAPVHQDEGSGVWSVFRYDDVQRVLSDWKHFSSRFGVYDEAGEAVSPIGASMIGTDPPGHTKLRTIVSGPFGSRAIAEMEPRIRAITERLLEPVASRGAMDLVSDLAEPLPVTVIAEMLGIPAEDRRQFKTWSDAIVELSNQFGSGDDAAMRRQREVGRYFLEVIQERRAHPGEDLISRVVRAEVDGAHLSDPDVLGFCILLLVAGNETTTNLIGNAVRCFLEHPALVERLAAHPDALPTAVEEVLRYRSPVRAMFRVALEDVPLDGTTIHEGESVLAWIGSANRDASKFPDAARFLPDRTPNPHIAFGHGIHQCLGAPLARLEGRIALEALLQRCRHLRSDADPMRLEPMESLIVHGVRHLPVTFDPAA